MKLSLAMSNRNPQLYPRRSWEMTENPVPAYCSRNAGKGRRPQFIRGEAPKSIPKVLAYSLLHYSTLTHFFSWYTSPYPTHLIRKNELAALLEMPVLRLTSSGCVIGRANDGEKACTWLGRMARTYTSACIVLKAGDLLDDKHGSSRSRFRILSTGVFSTSSQSPKPDIVVTYVFVLEH